MTNSLVRLNQFDFNRLDTWLINPLKIAPAIKIPIAGVNTGSQRRYQRSSPNGTPSERPTTAIASQKKLNKTRKTSSINN